MASLMGMAKPRPSASLEEDFALTRPMSSPFMLNRPPPELPGLTEASIWIRDMVLVELVPWMVTLRFRALTMPLVTVPPSSPSGLPTASTLSPTARLSLLPTVAGVRSVASILRTATSLVSSSPTTVAG